MDKFVAHLLENTLELTVGTLRDIITRNAFRLPDPQGKLAQSKCPEDFYTPSCDVVELKFGPSLPSPTGGTLSSFTFPSPHRSPYPENNIVHGMADLHPAGPTRGAVIFLHGHSMSTFLPLMWFTRPVKDLGMDVYYLSLPYHMQRRPRGTWGGQFSLSADVDRTAMAFRQGVGDVRALMTWIQRERHVPVALAGASLGAYTSCMTAVVDDRPMAVVALLGGGTLADILFDGFPFRYVRRDFKPYGYTKEQLREDWALLSPANWQPRVPKERILMLSGKFDPIVTPENTRKLWKAWNRPPILWYPCGHASITFYSHEVGREIARFLASCLEEDENAL